MEGELTRSLERANLEATLAVKEKGSLRKMQLARTEQTQKSATENEKEFFLQRQSRGSDGTLIE